MSLSWPLELMMGELQIITSHISGRRYEIGPVGVSVTSLPAELFDVQT